MSYKVHSIFYSLQGEGARTGRAAVFCRFSKCNLWNGREKDRMASICNFCDTDFLTMDPLQGAGLFQTPEALTKTILDHWPADCQISPYVILTGGEPALQADDALIDALHRYNIEVAIETNGTLPIPSAIDWVCMSPKGQSKLCLTSCDELKLVYPQHDCPPAQVEHIQADYYYLSAKATPTPQNMTTGIDQCHVQQALCYCLEHPKWRLSLQIHKLLNID